MADQIIQDQQFEIARLKDAIRRLAEQDATLSVCDGDVTVTMDATLTDEEREAVAVMERVANRTETLVVGIGPRHAKRFDGPAIAATLLGLLKRLG